MKPLYDHNGLVFWTEQEIQFRKNIEIALTNAVQECLLEQNKAWKFVQTEASILTPQQLINPNYTVDDIFVTDGLVLRPETTMGSYAYADYLLSSQLTRMPICVWQHGKSFRKEQNFPLTKMRLKEFYQLEFQCIYSPDTKNDYSEKLIPVVLKTLFDLIGDCRLEESDRLPDYSEQTIDVVASRNDMEVCSMSKRKDRADAKVFEIAVGTDRCVYNILEKRKELDIQCEKALQMFHNLKFKT